jgi:hypothetical protein
MSVLSSDEENVTIGDSLEMPESYSSLDARLMGATFAALAGVAMAGWLYLIAMFLWTCVGWLLS